MNDPLPADPFPTAAFAGWLALREPADAAARAPELAERVRGLLAGRSGSQVHDLGSGTGSMARWLAPRIPGPQHWILYDRDPGLLARARTGLPGAVTAETRVRDITRLTSDDLGEAALITASALLDMFTAEEIERIAGACAGAGCPVLFTLSVTGHVELTPPDPLDPRIAEAFDAHQRRTTADGRTLLGPDAAAFTAEALRSRGLRVWERPSPWRLGPGEAALTAEWLRGWVGAAAEQDPGLAGPAGAYTARRLAEAAAGRLGVVVAHTDLLAAVE